MTPWPQQHSFTVMLESPLRVHLLQLHKDNNIPNSMQADQHSSLRSYRSHEGKQQPAMGWQRADLCGAGLRNNTSKS